MDDKRLCLPAGGGPLCLIHRISAQFAQLPTSTGFGFGASVVVSGLYLLPATIGMTILGLKAGAIFGSVWLASRLVDGNSLCDGILCTAHLCPQPSLPAVDPAAALLGVGIGLAFLPHWDLIVQAVPSHQTGVASGLNTVMRTLGGALGGQLSATFIANNTATDCQRSPALPRPS